MDTLDKIEFLLPRVTKSQRIYLESVRRYVELNEHIYPTAHQAKIIDNMMRHHTRLEKEGLLGDCY